MDRNERGRDAAYSCHALANLGEWSNWLQNWVLHTSLHSATHSENKLSMFRPYKSFLLRYTNNTKASFNEARKSGCKYSAQIRVTVPAVTVAVSWRAAVPAAQSHTHAFISTGRRWSALLINLTIILECLYSTAALNRRDAAVLCY
jgi:hypothetical protein